jgi:hypothetical protein
MAPFAACGASFLVCVLWFDLMFDVQVRGSKRGQLVPPAVLQSISGYYRRVTSEARPMNLLIGIVMLATLVLLIAEMATGAVPILLSSLSFAAALSGVGLARVRIIPNAVRLGRATDDAETQSALSRLIYFDHVYCFAAMTLVLVLQLASPWLS